MQVENESEQEDPLINLSAEADMLGLLLNDNALVDAVADHLGAHDFHEPLHERIYQAILAEVASGNAANPATLRPMFVNDPAIEELGGPSYLARLTGESPLLMNSRDLAKHLAELGARRRMRDGLMDAVHGCADLSITRSELVADADAALIPASGGDVREGTAAQCLAELIEGFDQPIAGVRSISIPSLDELHGPMEPSQLIILAGRPGMGKTGVGITYALGAAAAGHGVLFISLEMNRQQLAGRMAADLCFDKEPIPYSAIRDRDLDAGQRKQVRAALTRAQSLPFAVVDVGSLSVGRLASIVRRWARRFAARGNKLELVVIDYLQLLRPDGRTNGKYEAVSEVSMALKAMAKDQELAVLALAQLSRSVEQRPDKRPQLADLRDSGQIEQDADSVIFLLRDEYYLMLAEPDPMSPDRPAWEQSMEATRNTIEFILAKRRNGSTGTVFGEYHGKYQAVRG